MQESPLAELTGLYGREALRVQATRVLDAVRAEILAGIDDDELADRVREIPERVRAALEAEAPPLRRVLNATGIFLHTGQDHPDGIAEVQPALITLIRSEGDVLSVHLGLPGDAHILAWEELPPAVPLGSMNQ